jgi:hypothetical protein
MTTRHDFYVRYQAFTPRQIVEGEMKRLCLEAEQWIATTKQRGVVSVKPYTEYRPTEEEGIQNPKGLTPILTVDYVRYSFSSWRDAYRFNKTFGASFDYLGLSWILKRQNKNAIGGAQ